MSLTYLEIIKRLFLSVILSGLIGIERESINKPAGFRTHILVCMGATTVMILSINMFDLYQYKTTMDPTRLGAQVISGIGFLGAGTIIREGASVKGLTTAASLWAIGCIGLSIGAGFYVLSFAATFFVFLTLLIFSKLEHYYLSKKNIHYINIVATNRSGQLGKIGDQLGEMNVIIKNIEMDTSNDDEVKFKLSLKLPSSVMKEDLVQEISSVDGVQSVKLLY